MRIQRDGVHTPRPVRRALILSATFVVVGLIGASCSNDSNDAGSAEPSTSTTTTSTTSTTPAPALVGTWTRTTTCQEYVERQTEAGFTDDLAAGVAGNGWLPGIDSAEAIPDLAHPCATAVPREHSHVFTGDGAFASLDWHGQQVDSGSYELVGDHTLVLPYSFEDGDAIDMTFD